jgi:phenylalanyl-tRNA synthetase alpha chain
VPDPGSPEDAPAAELTLSAPELTLLRRMRSAEGPRTEEALAEAGGLELPTVRGSLQRLRSKHLASVQEEHHERFALTSRGREARARGLPERRLLEALRARGAPVPAPELASVASLEGEERSIAVGVLRRCGYLGSGVPFRLRADAPPPSDPLPDEVPLAEVDAGAAPPTEPQRLAGLQRRGLIAVEHSSTRRWSPSAEGRALRLPSEDRPQLGPLTPALLRGGSWRGAEFRPYDVRAEVPYRLGPEPHPYAQFLEEFAEILVGLGFREAEGPLVETEFWNNDILFMPQEHPARSVHDAFFLRGVEGRLPPERLLARVAAVHEGRPMPGEGTALSPGWRVPYRTETARHPVLRSQTTAVSARVLASRPAPPFRFFALDRNFRPDAVDATHHVEFAQCEGIVGEPGTTLRDLIGLFQELAASIGIHELRVRPSYFPFTEPSVEGWVRHPRLGWIEVFPGGMLRPEVLGPLEVGVPVAAWGIGVARLAMIALRANDIRELYTDDLGRLMGRRS